jgi:hypothetical protein
LWSAFSLQKHSNGWNALLSDTLTGCQGRVLVWPAACSQLQRCVPGLQGTTHAAAASSAPCCGGERLTAGAVGVTDSYEGCWPLLGCWTDALAAERVNAFVECCCSLINRGCSAVEPQTPSGGF